MCRLSYILDLGAASGGFCAGEKDCGEGHNLKARSREAVPKRAMWMYRVWVGRARAGKDG